MTVKELRDALNDLPDDKVVNWFIRDLHNKNGFLNSVWGCTLEVKNHDDEVVILEDIDMDLDLL